MFVPAKIVFVETLPPPLDLNFSFFGRFFFSLITAVYSVRTKQITEAILK